MSNKPITINELLGTWGLAQHQTSPRNEIIKAQVLESLVLKPAANPSSVPKFNFAWLSLALAGFAVITFFIIPSVKTVPKLTQTHTSYIAPTAPAPMANKFDAAGGRVTNPLQDNLSTRSYELQGEPPMALQSAPSNDSREFLKTGYSASIKIKSVQNLTDQIQTTVRGFNGRVDSSSNSQESGFISFVVPAENFDAFKQQVKGLVNYRFYSETTQTENLLPQKTYIEDRQNKTNGVIGQLEIEGEELTTKHNQTVAFLNSQIQSAKKQLADLQNQTTTDVARALQIEQQKQDLNNQIKNLQSSLSGENYQYNGQFNSLNMQIRDQNQILENLDTQNNNLLDNVATVNGTISIIRISSWEAFNAYVSPGYWVPGLLLILAIATYWVSRRQSQLIIP